LSRRWAHDLFAMVSGDPAVKSVHIAMMGTTFSLALYAGMEPAALTSAVAARAGISQDSGFFLTATLPAREEEGEVVVPLSSALPDGLRLHLRRSELAQPQPQSQSQRQLRARTSTLGSIAGSAPLSASGSFRRREGSPGRRDRSPLPRESAFASPALSGRSRSGRGSMDQSGLLLGLSGLDTPLLGSRPDRSVQLDQASPIRGRSAELQQDVDEDARGLDEDDGDANDTWMNIVMSTVSGKPQGQEKRQGFFQRGRRRSIGVAAFCGLDRDVDVPEAQPSSINRHASFQELEMVTAVERFSRLSTELANERTLLAWVRTCLAAVRTSLAYVGFAAVTGEWWVSLLLAQWGMIALIVLASVAGAARYYKLKAILNYKVPPKQFGRISVAPMNALVVTAAMATAAGCLAKAWQKQ
jgi:uncharacterized membrane protein YidH (DUF202 family)